MLSLLVTIVRWVDPTQPDLVACQFTDAWGQEHTIVDKVSMFTAADLDEQSHYPQPGWIACTVVGWKQHVDGSNLCIIDTTQPWQMESTNGRTRFEVRNDQLLDG